MVKQFGESGLTFVEMMVSVTIFSLLILALYGLLDGGMAMYQTSDAHLEQMQNMRIAMETLGRDIREAKSIDFKNNQLTLTLPNNQRLMYGLGDENIYGPSGLKGKKLWKSAPSSPIASYLTSFEVNAADKLVTVKLTASSPKGRVLTLENTFTLRN